MTRLQEKPRTTTSSNTTEREILPTAAKHAQPKWPAPVRDTNSSSAKLERVTEEALDQGLEETFPGSDPVSVTRRSAG